MTALHVLRDIILVHKLLQPIRIQPRRHLAMDVLKEANHSGKKRNKVRSVQVICTCSLCFHLLAADTTVSTRSDVWNWDADESRRAWRSASQREPRSIISRLPCRVTQATKEQQIWVKQANPYIKIEKARTCSCARSRIASRSQRRRRRRERGTGKEQSWSRRLHRLRRR